MKHRILHFLLRFCPTSVERSPPDKNGMVTERSYKTLFGVDYLVQFQRYIPPPKHPNCRCAALFAEAPQHWFTWENGEKVFTSRSPIGERPKK